MVLLPNCLLNIARSQLTKATSVTNAPKPLTTGILAHIMPNVQSAYKMLPEAAMESDFVAKVESGTDVRLHDVVTSITLPDGVTPWPGLGIGQNDNEVFHVAFIAESTPGPLAERRVYIRRITGGGRVYS